MITLRRSQDRGHFDHGWLDTYHSFSFADYHDPGQMGFRSLRVINEDRVEPGQGFPMHPHRDMEIITYVTAGALEHKDSMGNGTVIRPGEVQRMSAGTGILHSEFNPSPTESVHLLQIWIRPAERGLTPGYEQKSFDVAAERNRLCLVASPDGRDGSVTIHQDVHLSAAVVDAGATVSYGLRRGRFAWVQVVRGELLLNGATLQAGDGAAVANEESLRLTAGQESECLLFDLA